MNIDRETGQFVAAPTNPRFKLWLTFLVCATVTMVSAIGVKRSRGDSDSNAKWAVTCSILTVVATGLVVLLHMFSAFSVYIVDTKAEGILTLVLTVFWGSTVAVVSNATNGLAVDDELDNTIVNGNLYYFSWAGFVTSVMLVVAYLRGVFGVDLAGEIHNRAARLTAWSALLACQLVVMGASANALDKHCVTDVDEESFCKRTKYGIALGAIGTIFSLGVVSMKMITAIAPFVVEAALSLYLSIMNGIGVFLLTSAKGPGSPIGNLYYFSWLSFLSSIYILASVYEDYGSVGVVVDDKKEETDVENMNQGI